MAQERGILDTKRSGKVIKLDATINEAERLKTALDSFSFDGDIEDQPKVILLWGEPSVGKSHLFSTLSTIKPLYVMDTEDRYAGMAKKFGIKTWKHVASFEEAFVFIRYIIKNDLPPGIVVFDSSTDIRIYAEQRTLFEDDKDVIGKARNWGRVWDKLDWMLDALKDKGHWIVFTARAKDVYADEKATGELKPNTYSRVEYWADCILHLKKDGSRILQKPLPHQVTNGFKVLPTHTLPEILKGLEIIE